MIEARETALACSGLGPDGFWAAIYHHECRKAEEGINKLHDFGGQDDWMGLSDIEWDDWPWLIEEFPAAAERMKITTARFEEIRAERERMRKAWAERNRP